MIDVRQPAAKPSQQFQRFLYVKVKTQMLLCGPTLYSTLGNRITQCNPSVFCPSVCPVLIPLILEQRSLESLKWRFFARVTCNSWTSFEMRRSKAKVIRSTYLITENTPRQLTESHTNYRLGEYVNLTQQR